MSADQGWRLFYNALDVAAARRAVNIDGDAALVEPLLGARSVLV